LGILVKNTVKYGKGCIDFPAYALRVQSEKFRLFVYHENLYLKIFFFFFTFFRKYQKSEK